MSSFDSTIRLILDGQNLPDDVYDKYDVAGLDNVLLGVDENGDLFELDGSEYGETTVTYFIYCCDAASTWPQIEAAVKAYPLCSGAEVEFVAPNGEIERAFRLPVA